MSALVRDDILRPVASGPVNLPRFTGQDDLLAGKNAGQHPLVASRYRALADNDA